MKYIIKSCFGLFFFTFAFTQEKSNAVSETFSGIKIINSHSTKTLKKREFSYVIEHRFGDIAGSNGGVQTGFGFDNANDIRFGGFFGLTDRWMVGFGRSKGIGEPYRSLVDVNTKYRLWQQTEKNEIPVSVAFVSAVNITYMKALEDISSVASFPKFSHRLSYSSQLVITRKFGTRLAVALTPTYVHRNYVRFDDVNGLFALGGAMNLKVTKKIGLTAEYFHAFSQVEGRADNTNSLALGLEWITSGHVFNFNFTNARGIGEVQYISSTTSDWLKGQFRFGFSISRVFKY
ncbi:MAG: DUF5777 family beta-barrel protein [Lishizhenia sp.]